MGPKKLIDIIRDVLHSKCSGYSGSVLVSDMRFDLDFKLNYDEPVNFGKAKIRNNEYELSYRLNSDNIHYFFVTSVKNGGPTIIFDKDLNKAYSELESYISSLTQV